METTFLIFILVTLVNVFLAFNLYGKLNAVNDMIDSLDELDDRIDEIEDYIEEFSDLNKEDGVDCELLQSRVQTLENNTIQNISELSELRTMLANLNQHVAEVAAFADRVNARIDQMGDRPESF